MKRPDLKSSWDKVNPSAEVKQRMLQNILSPAAPARKVSFRSLRLALACCLVLAVCLTVSFLPQEDPKIRETSAVMPESAAAEPEESTDTSVCTAVSDCWAAISIPDMAEDSSLILRGTVTGHSESFRILDGYGNVWNRIDYYVEPIELLRGELNGAQQVSVRLPEPASLPETAALSTGGGFLSDGLEIGREYVFFLTQHRAGMGMYALGGYYDPISQDCGIFRREGESFVSRAETLSLDSLKEQTAVFRDIPFDPDWERRERLETYRSNAEEGTFTREACEQDIAMLDTYAAVLDSAVGSEDGDPRLALPRSFHMNAQYVDAVPENAFRSEIITCSEQWNDEDRLTFFREENRCVFLGTVESVDTVEVWTDPHPETKTHQSVLTLRVESVLQGEEAIGPAVTVLLPAPLYEGAGGTSPDPLYRLVPGIRGIFPVTLLDDGDCLGEDPEPFSGSPALYLKDLAACRLDSHARGLVLETPDGLDFLTADYPAVKRTLSLDAFAAYLQFYLDSDRS